MYSDQNIFARILKGEAPCIKVYEDERTLSFMDIAPRADGHVLVIPKSETRNILDVSLPDLEAVMSTVQKICLAQMEALGADGVIVQQFNESAAGQIVFHLHVHVIPRFDGKPLRPPAETPADTTVLKTLASQIASALPR